jgi:serine/threonine-protein kinase
MTAEGVGAQLERILSSPLFAQSPRLRAFLRYVVDAHRSGEPQSLKEYAIATEVFERGSDFDPRLDPIVRVQAAKLRSRLIEYYAADGASDPIVISIPKGAYVPEIRQGGLINGPARATSLSRRRIAVLPFVNMSPDPENEYFSDGLTEELINRLAGVGGLQVVARTSSFAFKGHNEDLREIGAKLNVGTILEGSVRRAGDQLRMTAQLIDVETGYHLFSRTYQRGFKSIFELQDELAQSVVDEIAPECGGTAARRAETQTENLDGYNAYLKGIYALGNRFVDLPQSLEFFREALNAAPEYAPAWAGLAHSYYLLAWFYQAPPDEALALAKQAASRTLAIDPVSAIGLSSLASLECAMEWRWQSAEERFRRAMELQPSIAVIYMQFVFCCLIPQRRDDEACSILERALSVDPFNPLLHSGAVDVYGRAGRHDDSDRQYALARNVGPGYAPLAVAAGMAQEWRGDLDHAIAHYRNSCDLSRNAPYPVSCLAHALAVKGEASEAKRMLQQLLQFDPQPGPDIARVYVGLQDFGSALHWLDQSAAQRSLYLLKAVGDPRFDRLLAESRYRKLLDEMGLSYARAKQPPEQS